MVREDMAAHKMVAMLERIGKTNRDIFDVWFFLKNNWQSMNVLSKHEQVCQWNNFCKPVLILLIA